jgi:hypothetical protein
VNSTAISIVSIIISIAAIVITIVNVRSTPGPAPRPRTYGGYPAGPKTGTEMAPPPAVVRGSFDLPHADPPAGAERLATPSDVMGPTDDSVLLKGGPMDGQIVSTTAPTIEHLLGRYLIDHREGIGTWKDGR